MTLKLNQRLKVRPVALVLLKRIKTLSDNKKKDLRSMCNNFISEDRWHELFE